MSIRKELGGSLRTFRAIGRHLRIMKLCSPLRISLPRYKWVYSAEKESEKWDQAFGRGTWWKSLPLQWINLQRRRDQEKESRKTTKKAAKEAILDHGKFKTDEEEKRDVGWGRWIDGHRVRWPRIRSSSSKNSPPPGQSQDESDRREQRVRGHERWGLHGMKLKWSNISLYSN